jgi:hypothetical protein
MPLRTLRCAVVAGALATLTAAGALAQDQTQEPRGIADPARAIDNWLGTDQVDKELLGRTVAAVLDAGVPGLRGLGQRLRAAGPPTGLASRALRSLATHVCLGFLKRQADSRIAFAGQYAPLGELQPYAGELLLGLLLEPPDWFPYPSRKDVIPALRDLFTAPPPDAALDAMAAIADNADEDSAVRRAVAHALFQWGRPRYVQPELDRWRKQSTEGTLEDRVAALRELAEVHYQLRDYRSAAMTHLSLQSLAGKSGVELRPADFYGAACCLALSGDVERAFAALEQCALLQASASVDPSLKMTRQQFERDPELARLRGGERFERLLQTAFGKTAARDKDR